MKISKKSWHYKIWRFTKTDEDAEKPISVCAYLAQLSVSPAFIVLLGAMYITILPIDWAISSLEEGWKKRFPEGACPHGGATFE